MIIRDRWVIDRWSFRDKEETHFTGTATMQVRPTTQYDAFAGYGRRVGLQRGPRGSSLRPAFSMAELMIAVVILGIGLLITSSMFPIAWYKAKDVAEATDLTACSNSAEVLAKQLLRVNAYDETIAELSTNYSSFVPGDWMPTAGGGNPVAATVYPDARVHHLNLGNYTILPNGDGRVDIEPDPFVNSQDMPVADCTWALDDAMAAAMEGTGGAVFRNSFQVAQLHYPKIAPHVRLFPAMPKRPILPETPSEVQKEELAQWDTIFQTRRYCWSVFYRFEEMAGPDGSENSVVDDDLSTQAEKNEQLEIALKRPRLLTMYYFMLKRPLAARYARQSGFDCESGSCEWPTSERPTTPRARTPDDDVRLPVPWLIEAQLTRLPANGAVATGIPSEISSGDEVVIGMLQVDSVLLDDRTGGIYRVVTIRQGLDGKMIYSLDREYTFDDLFFNQREPLDGNESNWSQAAADNWRLHWDIVTGNGAGTDGEWSESEKADLDGEAYAEQDKKRRFYWVFPPPVEGVRLSSGVPAYDGTQPVVGVEVRQMVVEP